LVKKFLFVATVLLSISIAVATTARIVYPDLVGGTYVYVCPPVYVANAVREVFTTNINISSGQNLRAFVFKLGYNTTLLDAVEVVQGTFFPSSPKAYIEKLEINKTMGFVWVHISLPSYEPTIGGSGTLATITFNVTFAPIPPEEASCTLDLYDTSLYDGSMTAIAHDSTDGLYCWESIPVDPPIDGRLLDLITQKGGIGQGVFGGAFTMVEMIELTSNLTYNGYPVGAKLVAFQVLNPINETILAQVAVTNSGGIATLNFSIPLVSKSLGAWTAFSSAQVADKVVSDFLSFDAISGAPTHSPIAKFTENPHAPLVYQLVYFDASASQPGFDGDDASPIAEYRWDFGDGNKTNTTGPTVYHTYLNAGIYYVSLTVYAPGITPYIDSQYIDTNTTYPPERKVVNAVPVGGYSQLGEKHVGTRSILPYLAFSITLTVSFVAGRKKKLRRK
jgi:hypothetical protein